MTNSEKMGLIAAIIVVIGDAVALLALLVDSDDDSWRFSESNIVYELQIVAETASVYERLVKLYRIATKKWKYFSVFVV